MFEFDFFDPSLGSVTVSVAEYGLTFSRAAVEVLGRPNYIMLAYDKNKCVIGVVPVEKSETRKIEFISKVKNGYVRINTKDFIRFLMKYYPDDAQMFGSKATRYFSYWDENNKALIVDLKRPIDQVAEEEKNNEDEKEDKYEKNGGIE